MIHLKLNPESFNSAFLWKEIEYMDKMLNKLGKVGTRSYNVLAVMVNGDSSVGNIDRLRSSCIMVSHQKN